MNIIPIVPVHNEFFNLTINILITIDINFFKFHRLEQPRSDLPFTRQPVFLQEEFNLTINLLTDISKFSYIARCNKINSIHNYYPPLIKKQNLLILRAVKIHLWGWNINHQCFKSISRQRIAKPSEELLLNLHKYQTVLIKKVLIKILVKDFIDKISYTKNNHFIKVFLNLLPRGVR